MQTTPTTDGFWRANRGALLLLTPVLVTFGFLYFFPLFITVRESLKTFIPGRIGGVAGSFTLANYIDLLHPVYLDYFLDTFRISLIATILALIAGYPIAYYVARRRSGLLRTGLVAFLICMLFLGIIVRVYSLVLTLGPVGILHPVAKFLGLQHNDLFLVEATVILGLMHNLIPIISLTLMGTIHNVNPMLEDAAQSLGAPRWKAFLSVTAVLSLRGIISSFLLAYALAISSFVVPMVLGKGIVVFATNLIYERFSEVADFPGGAAISVVMLALSVIIVYGVLRIVTWRFDSA
jgi:putative spermidine/putrescine transport system permease protein